MSEGLPTLVEEVLSLTGGNISSPYDLAVEIACEELQRAMLTPETGEGKKRETAEKREEAADRLRLIMSKRQGWTESATLKDLDLVNTYKGLTV